MFTDGQWRVNRAGLCRTNDILWEDFTVNLLEA